MSEIEVVEREEEKLPEVSRFQNNETGKPTKKKIILWSCVVLLVLGIAAAGYGTVMMTRHQKAASTVRNYNKEFEAIESAGEAFKSKVNTPPDDKKTLQDLIAYYMDLKSQVTFEAKVKTLNANPKYASLKPEEKKDYASLDLDKTANDLNDLLKDIDKLQSIVQRSDNLDTDIKSMETAGFKEGDAWYEKLDELKHKNGALKDEALSVVLTPKLKEAQNRFVEALTYRGKYLTDMVSFLEAAESYTYMSESYDRHLENIRNDVQQALKEEYYYESMNKADDEADKAEKLIKSMEQKWKDQQSSRTDAATDLAKYNESMGIAQADAVQLNTSWPKERAQHPFVGEEKIKIFTIDYLMAGMLTLKKDDFLYVGYMLDKSGKQYQEQMNYKDYLKGKGIKEQLLAAEAKSVEKIDETSFKVTTNEKYDITYGDGSRKIKSFTSTYKIVKSNISGIDYLVNELLETKETGSEDQ